MFNKLKRFQEVQLQRSTLSWLCKLRWTLGSLQIFLCLTFSVMPTMAMADTIEIIKHKHTLNLIQDGKTIKSYSVALGRSPIGAKQKKGDNKTPEGSYVITAKNSQSRYYKSLKISYPNAHDIEKAREQKMALGGDIMIHALPSRLGWIPSKLQKLHTLIDWTQGCVAVTNAEMDEIWQEVKVGTAVKIFP